MSDGVDHELHRDLKRLNQAFRVWQDKRDDVSFDMLLLAHGDVFGLGGSFREWEAIFRGEQR